MHACPSIINRVYWNKQTDKHTNILPGSHMYKYTCVYTHVLTDLDYVHTACQGKLAICASAFSSPAAKTSPLIYWVYFSTDFTYYLIDINVSNITWRVYTRECVPNYTKIFVHILQKNVAIFVSFYRQLFSSFAIKKYPIVKSLNLWLERELRHACRHTMADWMH